ncbi:MAG: transporter substrate-binding domain-containing protein [Bacilli bacterium]|nr:transporter substrate-binding domain-containing protein [Bacilli bacterium]MBN2877873.1 transporter substrate-binding domain-containing protein [Bacilli bacterium]
MKKIILAFALTVVLALTGCDNTTAVTESTTATPVVTVMTSSGYAPYEMVDNDGDLIGFDIELMEAIAAEAGVTIEWIDVDFSGIIASLQAGQYEVAIAGISPTPARAEVVDFSNVYYNTESGLINYLIYSDDASYTTLDDLDGLVIGAQLGTVQAEMLQGIADEYGFTVELRGSNSLIVEEMKIGTIDALLVESLAATEIVNANTDLTSSVFEYSADSFYGNAIAFAKDSEYVDLFNQALATLQENGTVAALIDKWFTTAETTTTASE